MYDTYLISANAGFQWGVTHNWPSELDASYPPTKGQLRSRVNYNGFPQTPSRGLACVPKTLMESRELRWVDPSNRTISVAWGSSDGRITGVTGSDLHGSLYKGPSPPPLSLPTLFLLAGIDVFPLFTPISLFQGIPLSTTALLSSPLFYS